MTDEEIELILSNCPKGTFSAKVYDYINRLKAENESKENCTIEQHAEIHRLKDQIHEIRQENIRDRKKIRKDTAKEILRDMQLRLLHDYTDEETGYQYPNIATADIYQDLKEIAKKYDVEVDDNV